MARPGSSHRSPTNDPNQVSVDNLLTVIQSVASLSSAAIANEREVLAARLSGVFGEKFKQSHMQEIDLLVGRAAFPTTAKFLDDYKSHIKAAMKHLAEAQWNLIDVAGAKNHNFSGAQFQANATAMSLTAGTASFSMGLLNISTKHQVTLANYANTVVDVAYSLHKHYWLRSEGTATLLSSHMLLHALAGLELQTLALSETVGTRVQYSDVYINQVGTDEVIPESLRKPNKSKGNAINIARNVYSISSGKVTMIDGPRLMLNSGRAPKKGPAVKELPLLPTFPKTVVLPTIPLTGIEVEEAPVVMPFGASKTSVNKPKAETSSVLGDLLRQQIESYPKLEKFNDDETD